MTDSVYPKRDVEVGPILQGNGAGGGRQDGNIKIKTIQVQNLVDAGAFPWFGHWYNGQVERALGPKMNDTFRTYFMDNANHFRAPHVPAEKGKLIGWQGIIFQVLLYLVDWVENGVTPPPTTNYRVDGGQIVVPEEAAKRGGIQPVVHLSSKGSKKVDVSVGETVSFEASAAVPPGVGKIIKAEWDYDGTGDNYVDIDIEASSEQLDFKTTHTYTDSGTYHPSIRVHSHREGNVKEKYVLVSNMDRIRVVVSA